jgi:hypothetical protein
MARAAVDISTLYQRIRDDLDKVDKAADFSFGIWRHDPDDIGANWNAAIRRIRGDAADTKWQEVLPKLRTAFSLIDENEEPPGRR